MTCHRCSKVCADEQVVLSIGSNIDVYFCSPLCQEYWLERYITKAERKQTFCDYCKLEQLEFYVVTDEVWLSVMPDKKGNLHLGCLEAKLGRQLKIDDLKRVPVNALALHFAGI